MEIIDAEYERLPRARAEEPVVECDAKVKKQLLSDEEIARAFGVPLDSMGNPFTRRDQGGKYATLRKR